MIGYNTDVSMGIKIARDGVYVARDSWEIVGCVGKKVEVI